jgi:hypothetical protein
MSGLSPLNNRHCIHPSGAPIHWVSSKQPTVALSSAKAEYIAAAYAARDLTWIIQLAQQWHIPLREPISNHRGPYDTLDPPHPLNYVSTTRALSIWLQPLAPLSARNISTSNTIIYNNKSNQTFDAGTSAVFRTKSGHLH